MRYATFRYGTAKYGAETNPRLLWALEVDWNDDGLFDGVNEAYGRLVGLTATRGRDRMLSAGGTTLERFPIGSASLTLDNSDRRYNPYNTRSPLYPNVDRGKRARLWVRDGATGTDYALIAGVVEDIRPGGTGSWERVTLTISEAKRWLEEPVNISTRAGIATDTAMALVLAAAGWPAGWGASLEAGAYTIPYWWATNKKAADALDELAASELGVFYTAANGQAQFRNRYWNGAAVATLAEANLSADVGLPAPWDSIRNRVRVTTNPRSLGALGVLWSLPEGIQVDAGASKTLAVTFSNPATGVVAPVATTDYLANSAADGTGANLTASFAVALTEQGAGASLVVTNGGAAPGYVTFLQVRGQALTAGAQATAEAAAAGYSTKPRTLALNLPWLQSLNLAEDYADYLVGFLADLSPFPVVQIETRPALQFLPDLADKVTLSLPSLGIAGDFRVGKIQHTWLDESGQSVHTRLTLEPFQAPGDYWVLGVDALGTGTVLGV